MKRFLNSYLFHVLSMVLFTAAALYFTLKNQWKEVVEVLLHVHPFGLLLVFLLAISGQCLLGWILQTLTCLCKKDYRFDQGLVNALVASFFHGITPGASGGQVAQMFVFSRQGVPVSESASILWMDFIIYQSCMSLTALVLLLLRFKRFSVSGGSIYALVFLGFLVNLCVIIGLWALAHMKPVYTWITTTGLELGVRLHLIKDRTKALSSLNAQLEHFEIEKNRLKQHKLTVLKTCCLNLVRQFLTYSMPFFCALALGVDVQFDQFIDMMALCSFVSMINCFILVPGASGGTEAAFIYMFSLIFDKIEAAGIMILWRFCTYYFIMIIGGLAFLIQKFQIFHDERGK